jgi:hypothetical protein
VLKKREGVIANETKSETKPEAKTAIAAGKKPRLKK